MIFAILITFLIAGCAPWIVSRTGRHAGWVLGLVPAALFVYFATWIPVIWEGGIGRVTVEWVPTLDIQFAFVVDGLSLLFALLIASLGTAILAYAGTYLEGDSDLGRFYAALIAFMASMLGLVLADDLIALFVFWELTSITSYLLIGYKHEKESARSAALQALLVTGGGGLALLAGVLLLSLMTGTTSISAILASGSVVSQHALYLPAFVLIAVGAFTKSAQLPFHFWLPNAMEAPTPVSAFLHSATMVKAGVYLLARLDPVLGGTPAWTWTLTLVGGATMLLGAISAVAHTDLKKVLAYSTITALGTLVVLIGLSYPSALKAAVVFLIVHSLYKSVLFLVAGAVDHETGTRDIREVSGLRGKMPYTFAAAVLAGLSMAGLPPLFGFVAKELTYKAKLGVEGMSWVLPSVAVVANALTVVAVAILVIGPFLGRARSPKAVHEAPVAMWLGPVILGAAGLLFGLAPGLLAGIVGPAVDAMAGEAVPIQLSLWYGLNTALVLSVITIVLGVIGAWQVETLRAGIRRLDGLRSFGPQAVYVWGMAALPRVAKWQTAFFEGGSLRTYLRSIVLTILFLVGGTYLWFGEGLVVPVPSLQPIELIVVGMTVIAAVAVTVVRSRLVAVTALGVVGIGVALLYVFVSAPDLAMTQFLVEILIVVLVLMLMYNLPDEPVLESVRSRVRDAAIAIGAGALVTTVLLAVNQVPISRHLSDFFGETAVPGGFGRNVVNVILVDFRALDTLGEVAVIAVAAIGVLVLLKMKGQLPVSIPSPQPSVVLQTGTRLLMSVLLLASLFLLWRGHNEPGGGFIGGLVGAAALVLYTIAYRAEGTQRILRVAPRILVGAGLAVALVSGLFAVVTGQPFLTGLWVSVGDSGALKLGTPLLFDIGVFITVVGVVLTMVLSLEALTTDGGEENSSFSAPGRSQANESTHEGSRSAPDRVPDVPIDSEELPMT
ncbi:putative monovalent cation/H+ antiporter subunit A [Longibacter salinarum]|uniref:putative monovalent cation/H+ antiporter subunit A n=1 Tax=Longibacter salinarum TaxID=1850348 RepID=UPI0015CF7BE9|nr:putative monovalent cation/H+ antiporter subunit A [Longibacter salinarum]